MNKKIKCYVVLGNVVDMDLDERNLIEQTFSSEEEKRAYLNGLQDACETFGGEYTDFTTKAEAKQYIKTTKAEA